MLLLYVYCICTNKFGAFTNTFKDALKFMRSMEEFFMYIKCQKP